MEEKVVNLTIDNIPVTVPAGTTVLEAARSAGIKIPSLCFLKDVNEIGACRICVVEVEGARSLMASCVYPVSEGMVVHTNTPKVRHSRQLTLELILSNHRMDCLTCSRNAQCELRQLAADLGIDAVRYANDDLLPQIEDTALHLGAGQLQVHPVPPVRGRLPQAAGGGRHRHQRPRLQHPHRLRL